MASKFFNHGTLERNVSLLGIAALITVAIGGIVEIAPLFWIDNTIEEVEGMPDPSKLSADELDDTIAYLKKQMREAAKELQFELAASLRDQMRRYESRWTSLALHPLATDGQQAGNRGSEEQYRARLRNEAQRDLAGSRNRGVACK